MARAATDPDENLYGIVGTNTHRKLQVAADENARRIWAAAVAGQKRLPRNPKTFDTRWIPAALYVATIAIVVFGFWLWNHKAERNARSSQVTLGELPAHGDARRDDGLEGGDGDITGDDVAGDISAGAPTKESAGPNAGGDAPAEDRPGSSDRASLRATSETQATSKATTGELASLPASASASARPRPKAASTGQARPHRSPKKASEQRIFTDAPF